MISFSKFDCVLWDFDGVLMDSMPIRDRGFIEVLSHYPALEVQELLNYHRANGGLSRYVKFRYFFESIRHESITDEKVMELAEQFSTVVMSLLLNPKLLIQDSLKFVMQNYDRIDMHIVSGSDGTELNEICRAIGIASYFKSIQGSPTPKTALVARTLQKYPSRSAVLIGDSINDLQAAEANGITFVGYNNTQLKALSPQYIERFAYCDTSDRMEQSYGK